jgi:hypothetical protein
VRNDAPPPFAYKWAPRRIPRQEKRYQDTYGGLVRVYLDMLRTEPAALPGYQKLDQLQQHGYRIQEAVLQGWWDSLEPYKTALVSMRLVLQGEGLSIPEEGQYPYTSPTTERLLARSDSFMNIYSGTAVDAFLARVAAWLRERRTTLQAMEQACALLSIPAVLNAQAALQPLQAVLGRFGDERGRDIIMFRDVLGNKILGGVR